MNEQEFCQNQVGRINRDIREVREEIERLMQVEELLIEDKERWYQRIGNTATLFEVDYKPKLHIIQGEKQ